jgi:hypothetical protein
LIGPTISSILKHIVLCWLRMDSQEFIRKSSQVFAIAVT